MKFVDDNPELNKHVSGGVAVSIAFMLTGFILYEYVGGFSKLLSIVFLFSGAMIGLVMIVLIHEYRRGEVDWE